MNATKGIYASDVNRNIQEQANTAMLVVHREPVRSDQPLGILAVHLGRFQDSQFHFIY